MSWEYILKDETSGPVYRPFTTRQYLGLLVYDFVEEKETASLKEIIDFLQDLARRPDRDIGPKMTKVIAERRGIWPGGYDYDFGRRVDKLQRRIKQSIGNKTDVEMMAIIGGMKFLTMSDDNKLKVDGNRPTQERMVNWEW